VWSGWLSLNAHCRWPQGSESTRDSGEGGHGGGSTTAKARVSCWRRQPHTPYDQHFPDSTVTHGAWLPAEAVARRAQFRGNHFPPDAGKTTLTEKTCCSTGTGLFRAGRRTDEGKGEQRKGHLRWMRAREAGQASRSPHRLLQYSTTPTARSKPVDTPGTRIFSEDTYRTLDRRRTRGDALERTPHKGPGAPEPASCLRCAGVAARADLHLFINQRWTGPGP